MKTIYNISKKEINRRIIAYTSLIIFYFISLIFFSFNYIKQYLNVFLFIILILVLVLFLSRIIVVRYLNSLLKTNIELTPEYIKKNNTKYLIKNIKKVIIKRTSKGLVREIKIKLNNNISTYINNSIEDIEGFTEKLKQYLSNNTDIKYIKEPLDFDNIIFYPILGILIGFISVKTMEFFFILDIKDMHFISYIISLFAFVLGLYFILYKPIHKRDEKVKLSSDNIWGVLFIIGALLVLLSSFFNS